MSLPTITVPQYTLTLPSTEKQVKYRPFLVKEEKILLLAMETEDEKQIGTAIKTIIENCVYESLNIDTMPMFDIEYIFLQLRGKSKGEVIELKYSCPKCKGDIALSLNIDDIKITRHEEHTNKIELTDNLGVMMKYPNLNLQMKVADTNKDKNKVEELFNAVIYCIDYIYDEEKTYSTKDHTKKEMHDFVDSLTDTQFQKMTKFFETIPALKHNITLDCKNKLKNKLCGYKEEVTLEGLQSFFT